ncbi:hypothetical protein BDY21DRAFT_372067 [Lineolata rhizophorae]|uniref:Plasmid pRiA4b Orf3-like domain-containing protein n=1 Tax=Lineolata rhizophorae TaxID=578093 RepID=A0A6A6NZV1_9PEZI|nr:hypothetical protein BDY21DRAFT_372067 [Lineolata rhizophorae]
MDTILEERHRRLLYPISESSTLSNLLSPARNTSRSSSPSHSSPASSPPLTTSHRAPPNTSDRPDGLKTPPRVSLSSAATKATSSGNTTDYSDVDSRDWASQPAGSDISSTAARSSGSGMFLTPPDARAKRAAGQRQGHEARDREKGWRAAPSGVFSPAAVACKPRREHKQHGQQSKPDRQIKHQRQRSPRQKPQGRPRSAPSHAPRELGRPAEPNYILQVTLFDTHDPTITRVLSVPAAFSVLDLHRAIQVAMGWTASHLAKFEVVDGVPEGGQRARVGRLDELRLGWGEGAKAAMRAAARRVYLEVRVDELGGLEESGDGDGGADREGANAAAAAAAGCGCDCDCPCRRKGARSQRAHSKSAASPPSPPPGFPPVKPAHPVRSARDTPMPELFAALAVAEADDGNDAPSRALEYTYDFADSWQHGVTVLGRSLPLAASSLLSSSSDSFPAATATASTPHAVCVAGEGHPAAEDVGGPAAWEKGLKEAYKTARPNKEQGMRRGWFENSCANGDAEGLGEGRVWVWDRVGVNGRLRGLPSCGAGERG